MDLALSDLLKNYLFGESKDRISEVQLRWISMLGALETVGGEELVVTYIRHLWSSKKGLTREKELYGNIKGGITSKQYAIDFASELAGNAILYAALLNPAHEIWNKYGSDTRKHITILNDLGMMQMRPLLMAILDKLATAEVRKGLKLMTCRAVRFLISGGLGSGTLETHYCLRAMDVRDGRIRTAKALIDAMRGIVPNDLEFRTAFADASVSKGYLARYYLRVLDGQAQGSVEQPLIPNDNVQVVNLEHILPQNPSADWGFIDAETAQAYYNRIGNLALLQTAINSDIGNAGFLAKRAAYEKSPFKLTAALKDFDTWGVTEIEERQRYLADIAVEAWPNRV